MNDATLLPVSGASPYDVVVGADLSDRLAAMLGSDVQRVAVVCPESLRGRFPAYLDALRAAYDVLMLAVPDGEAAKSAAVAAACWESLGEAG
ncbi:MAG: 3-dehydroquinate synthase, partial [Nocardioides sp.]|nr:3-dehydroquinate synthase [Nocardioides sp.]